MKIDELAFISGNNKAFYPYSNVLWYFNFDAMIIKWEPANAIYTSKIRRLEDSTWEYFSDDGVWTGFGPGELNPNDHNPIIEKLYLEWWNENSKW